MSFGNQKRRKNSSFLVRSQPLFGESLMVCLTAMKCPNLCQISLNTLKRFVRLASRKRSFYIMTGGKKRSSLRWAILTRIKKNSGHKKYKKRKTRTGEAHEKKRKKKLNAMNCLHSRNTTLSHTSALKLLVGNSGGGRRTARTTPPRSASTSFFSILQVLHLTLSLFTAKIG